MNLCIKHEIAISGTDVVTVIWFTNSRNHTFLPHNFYLPRKRWLNSWRWDICWGLHLLLHLEKKILGPGLLCRTTALHYNAVCLKCYINPPKNHSFCSLNIAILYSCNFNDILIVFDWLCRTISIHSAWSDRQFKLIFSNLTPQLCW